MKVSASRSGPEIEQGFNTDSIAAMYVVDDAYECMRPVDVFLRDNLLQSCGQHIETSLLVSVQKLPGDEVDTSYTYM